MFDSLLTTLLTPVIVVVVPAIIMLLKKLIPEKWAPFYPLIASSLGPALDYLSTYVTGLAANPGQGLLMGMAGVALREVVDQVKKVAKNAEVGKVATAVASTATPDSALPDSSHMGASDMPVGK